jgi:hypothetical protein
MLGKVYSVIPCQNLIGRVRKPGKQLEFLPTKKPGSTQGVTPVYKVASQGPEPLFGLLNEIDSENEDLHNLRRYLCALKN